MTKDLKATVEKATEAKESLIATQSELSLEQSKNASMLANSTQLNEELVNLRGKTKEQVMLVMGRVFLDGLGTRNPGFNI